jgi:sarcosine oxidase
VKVIVIGLGIIGSCTAYWLARRGFNVTAFDAFEQLHARGSSHGTTRITRLSYYESPSYVPLLRRSLELWRQLEVESGQPLTLLGGGLYVGDPECGLVKGAVASAREYGLDHEYLSAAEICKRFPCFALPAHFFGLYERTSAGMIFADRALKACQDLAVAKGASLLFNTEVKSWDATASGAAVRTADATFEADALVITGGAWMPRLMQRLNLPLEPVRVWTSYFNPVTPERFSADKMPVYCLEDEDGFFYGFPYEKDRGMKIGCHRGDMAFRQCIPDEHDSQVADEEIAFLQSKINRYLPGSAQSHHMSTTCRFTMTPDEHFIVDKLPGAEQVVYASACSGHGFKFGSVMGEVLGQLVTEGKTAHPIEFLSSARFAGSHAAHS